MQALTLERFLQFACSGAPVTGCTGSALRWALTPGFTERLHPVFEAALASLKPRDASTFAAGCL